MKNSMSNKMLHMEREREREREKIDSKWWLLNFDSKKESIWILWKNSIFSFFKKSHLSFLNLSTLKYLSLWFLSLLAWSSLLTSNLVSANSDSIFTIEWLNLNQEHISSNWWNNWWWNTNQWNNQKWEKKIIEWDDQWKLNYKNLEEFQKKYYMDWLNSIMKEWKFQNLTLHNQKLLDTDWDWLKEIVFLDKSRNSNVWEIAAIKFNWQTFELQNFYPNDDKSKAWYQYYYILEKNNTRKLLLLQNAIHLKWLHESIWFWNILGIFKNINTQRWWDVIEPKKVCFEFWKTWNVANLNITCPSPYWYDLMYKYTWFDISWFSYQFWNDSQIFDIAEKFDVSLNWWKLFRFNVEWFKNFNLWKWYVFSKIKFSFNDNMNEIYYYNENNQIERYVLNEKTKIYEYKEWTEESQWWWITMFDFKWTDNIESPKNSEWKIMESTEDQLVVTNNWDWTKNYMIQTKWEEIALSLWWKHWIYFKDLTWDWLKEVITYELMKSESIDKYFKLDIYTYKDWEYKKVLDWVRWTYLTNFDSNNDWIQDLAIRWLDWKINTYVFTWNTSQQTTEIEWDEIIFNDINWDWKSDVITKKKIQWTKDLWYFNIFIVENWAFVKKTTWSWFLWSWVQISPEKVLWTKLIWIKKSRWFKPLYFDKSQNVFKDLQSWKVLKTMQTDHLVVLNWWKNVSSIDIDWNLYINSIKDNTLKEAEIIDLVQEKWRCVNCTKEEIDWNVIWYTPTKTFNWSHFNTIAHEIWDDILLLKDEDSNVFILLRKEWDWKVIKIKVTDADWIKTFNLFWDRLLWDTTKWILLNNDLTIHSLNWITQKKDATWIDHSKVNIDLINLIQKTNNRYHEFTNVLYWISWRTNIKTNMKNDWEYDIWFIPDEWWIKSIFKQNVKFTLWWYSDVWTYEWPLYWMRYDREMRYDEIFETWWWSFIPKNLLTDKNLRNEHIQIYKSAIANWSCNERYLCIRIRHYNYRYSRFNFHADKVLHWIAIQDFNINIWNRWCDFIQAWKTRSIWIFPQNTNRKIENWRWSTIFTFNCDASDQSYKILKKVFLYKD